VTPRWLRLSGGVLCGAAALLTLVGSVGWVAAERRLSRVYRVTPDPVEVPADPSALARGRHLVEVVGQCTTCHGSDLAGRELADDPWLGRLWGPNLTPGRGGIGERSDADLVRAIRHGVKPDGRPVLMMPAQHFHHLSDADLGAIVAQLRRLPAIDREVPGRRLGPLSALAIASGRAPDLIPAELLASARGRPPAPAPAESPDYGAYLVEAGGCRVCHRADLAGGRHPLSLPEEPVPPDLTASGRAAGWSQADFVRALRTGITPEGDRLDDAWMPWRTIARMSDLELHAIHAYLRTLRGRS
jgi:mono/diheme cytochrome c family protein